MLLLLPDNGLYLFELRAMIYNDRPARYKDHSLTAYMAAITAEDLLTFMTTDYGLGSYRSEDLIIKLKYPPTPKNGTVWNRINILWVMPLYLVFAALPLYIFRGSYQWDSDSKVGKVFTKLLGKY